MLHQTMSGRKAQELIDCSAQRYAQLIRDEKLSLSDAHVALTNPGREELDLFQIAGLAKAIACFQCSAD